MRDILRILNGFPGASLAIRAGGPPDYEGGRVMIEGDLGGFRMLAGVLLAMAEAVESDPEIARAGWSLVFGPEHIPGLRMDDGTFLSLDCDLALRRDP